MSKKFSKKEALQFGWKTMKENLGFFIGLLIFFLVAVFIPSFVSDSLQSHAPVTAFIIDIFGSIVSLILSMGLIKISIQFARKKVGSWNDLFSSTHLFFTYLLGHIFYTIIVTAGLLLFIVPGIILSVRLSLFKYLIIDKEMGVLDSLRGSAELTQGVKWQLLLFIFILGIINVLGVLAFGIGLLVTIPVTIVSMAYVYRNLMSQTTGLKEVSKKRKILSLQ